MEEAGSFGMKNELNIRACAGQIPGTDLSYLKEAAQMFESAGKLEYAASCYCDLGEFERAGKIYADKCGKIDAAAECFTLAGCYSEAAEAYAKLDQFSNYMSVCKKGKLFYKGLQYIEYWKERVTARSKEIEQVDQEFWESGARHYHERKDPILMMKFVRAFCSIESKHVFLKSLGYLDDLLSLEEEAGHFLEAAELARSWGDLLKEADLLEKAGLFKEATVLLLWHGFLNSLWGNGNIGWPLKQIDQKEELCNKLKSLAEKDTCILYGFVFNELKVLCDHYNNLSELKSGLELSQKNRSLRGEILLIRKILDIHFHISSLKYEWENELPVDLHKHCDEMMFQNRVSVRTLLFYWNFWKKNVVGIFESLDSIQNDEQDELQRHIDFGLMHFGVKKHHENGNMIYLLVDKIHTDAGWVKNYGQEGLHKDGKRVTIDEKELVHAIKSYWQSELFSVGEKVLNTLQVLHKTKSKGSAFHQSTTLLHIFEVSKFLLDCEYLILTLPNKTNLQRFLDISSSYFDIVFPLDWRNALSEELISLRKTDLSVSLIDEITNQDVGIKGNLTDWKIGRVMMICLSSRKPLALYEMIIRGLRLNPKWKAFFEKFWDCGFRDYYVAQALRNALEDTLRSNGRYSGAMSLHSFVYILDRLVLMESFSSEIFFTTKSSFLEWFTHLHSTCTTISTPEPISDQTLDLVSKLVEKILYNINYTDSWIQISKIDQSYYCPLLALKLIMILSSICLKVERSQSLYEFLTRRKNISCLLPQKFVSNLLSRRKGGCLNLNSRVVAEAFASVEDPLLIVSSGETSTQIDAPCAMFVDLTKSKEEIMSILFPKKNTYSDQNSSNNAGVGKELPHKIPNVNPVEQMNCKALEKLSEAINRKKEEALNLLSAADAIQEELDKSISTLASALNDANRSIEELKVLSSEFEMSQGSMEHSVVTSGPSGEITMEHAVLEIEEQGETRHEENCVEETSYEHINSDDTSHMDAENKKRKGKKFKGNKKRL